MRTDTATCPIDARERAAIEEVKSMLGLVTEANVIRAAMWHYLRWLEPKIDPWIFWVER